MPETSSVDERDVRSAPRSRRGSYAADVLTRRDPHFIARIQPLMDAVADHYLRVRADGLENIPAGPALFVANHNGGIMGPDLACTFSVLWRALSVEHPLYALAHDFAMRHFTPLGRVLQRLGAIPATAHNGRQALEAGAKVLVYPGGDLEAYRTFARRNQIVILPRTGFVALARATGVPIVPIVTQGAHRSAFIFSEGEGVARVLRLQKWARLSRFPLALALPWGFAPGPWLPYLPLPFSIKLRILPKLFVAPSDDVQEVARSVEQTMQVTMNELAR